MVFLPEASSSDPKDAVSDWDSSSTVGGLKEAWETLEVRLASPAAPMEDTLELALLGRGGFVVTTVDDDDEAVVGGSGAVATLLLMTISDTDEVMDGCISETLVLEAALAAAEAAAMAAMLEAAS